MGVGRDPRSSRAGLLRWALPVGALLALVVPSAATSATTWQVTNTSDGKSICPSAGACTLRGAITNANAGSGDTVQVPAGHYTLALKAVPVTSAMQIAGPAGAAATVVEQLSPTVGLLSIAPSAADVTISGLTLTGGSTAGPGAVASQAPHLTLSGDVLTHNVIGASGATGAGAVGVSGAGPNTLTVTDTTFRANGAGGDGSPFGTGQGKGGAISFGSPGALAVTGSTFDANTAGGLGGSAPSSGDGQGGAIAVLLVGPVTATIANSTFTGNRAGLGGGIGSGSGTGDGGAIDFGAVSGTSSLTITNSTFSGNTAGGDGGVGGLSGVGSGGAIRIPTTGAVAITGSTFAGNRSGGLPGPSPQTGFGNGGAIANFNEGTTLVDDTFSGNTAMGAGGSLNLEAGATLVNDTVVGGSGTRGGNIAVGTGTSATLRNTIVAGGTAANGANCAGTIDSLGHNIESAATCALGGPGDRMGTDPLLGPLASNGGPTQTMALQPGSPAIDGGDNVGCPATDQRGVPRPSGAACDVGAFEVGVLRPSTGPAGSTAGPAVSLTNLKLTPTSFRAQPGRGASVGRIAKGGFGTTVSYADSGPAVTRFTVQRPRRGFRSARRCVAKRPANATGKVRRCTLYKKVGTFRHTDVAGPNRFRFNGRVGGKALGPGRYRLLAVARSAAGRLSRTLHASFRIVP